MKRISTLALVFVVCFLCSTALKAQLKASFTLSADTICSLIAEDFTNTSSGGTQPYKFLWEFGDGDTSTATNPVHIYYAAGNYKITLYVLDAKFDTNSTIKTITVLASPQPDLGGDKRGCWGHSIMLTTGLPHQPDVTWVNGTTSYHGDTIYVTDSGTYLVIVQNSAGCIGSDTVKVSFNPLVYANKIDSTVCLGDSVTLRAGIAGAGASYQWIDQEHGNRIVGQGTEFTFFASSTTGYGSSANLEIVIGQTLHGVTCTDTGYYDITVNTPTQPNLTAPSPKCINDPPFQLGGADPSHQGGTWSYPRNPSAIVNNFLYPSIMGVTANNPSLGWIHYIYANQYKCLTDDSIRISISPLPVVSAGHDTAICTKNGKYLLNNINVSPPGGIWFALNGTPSNAIVYSTSRDSVFFDPNASGVLDTVYGVIYSYQAPSACSNSDTVYIGVTSNCVSGINPGANPFLNLSVYPNPFSKSATIQYTLLKPSKVTVALFDVTGKQIALIETNSQLTGQYFLDINAEKYDLRPGVYLLKFMTDDGYVSRQIIKM